MLHSLQLITCNKIAVCVNIAFLWMMQWYGMLSTRHCWQHVVFRWSNKLATLAGPHATCKCHRGGLLVKSDKPLSVSAFWHNRLSCKPIFSQPICFPLEDMLHLLRGLLWQSFLGQNCSTAFLHSGHCRQGHYFKLLVPRSLDLLKVCF